MELDHSFRLVALSSSDGASQMAIDEAILEAHGQGLVPPTLRLYLFDPPAVSIGHSQELPDGLVERAAARGIEVVRRPTGGRAVLHVSDLTYSFIGTSLRCQPGRRGFLSESVAGAYKQICVGLVEALKILGLSLEMGGAGVEYRRLHDCFLATTGSDLAFRGLKMIGSAQLRRRAAVLQHGSLTINQSQSLMAELLGEPAPLGRRHANLLEALGRAASLTELSVALKLGFERAFGVKLVEAQLTGFEMALSRRLRDKFVIAREAMPTAAV